MQQLNSLNFVLQFIDYDSDIKKTIIHVKSTCNNFGNYYEMSCDCSCYKIKLYIKLSDTMTI